MKVILKCEVQRWNAQNNINAKYLYTCSSFSVHLFTHFNVKRHTNTLQKEIQFSVSRLQQNWIWWYKYKTRLFWNNK